MAASRARRRFPISLFAKLRHHVGNVDGGASGLSPAVDFVFEATLASLIFVIETEYSVDDGHAMIDCNALQCVGHGATEVFRVIGLAFQNYAAGNNNIGFFL